MNMRFVYAIVIDYVKHTKDIDQVIKNALENDAKTILLKGVKDDE